MVGWKDGWIDGLMGGCIVIEYTAHFNCCDRVYADESSVPSAHSAPCFLWHFFLLCLALVRSLCVRFQRCFFIDLFLKLDPGKCFTHTHSHARQKGHRFDRFRKSFLTNKLAYSPWHFPLFWTRKMPTVLRALETTVRSLDTDPCNELSR